MRSLKRQTLKPPIPWFGGKQYQSKVLLRYIPPHKTYVEPFGGAAALLFSKEPSQIEVYNDIHCGVVNLYRVLRDEDKLKRFERLAHLSVHSREEFELFKETWKDIDDDVERAYRFFYVARYSFSGKFGQSFGYNVKSEPQSRRYLAALNRMNEIHERLKMVQIENDDFRNVIRRYDHEDAFFYIDPPYAPQTRKGGKYDFEMSDEDHEELVDMALNMKGKVMISGYANSIYERLERNGWNMVDYEAHAHSIGRVKPNALQGRGAIGVLGKRIETLWMNYRV